MNLIEYLFGKRKRNTTQLIELSFVFDVLTPECKKDVLERLGKTDKPKYLCGRDVPEDLSAITFGQYSDLCDAMTGEDNATIKPIYEFAEIILGISAKDLNLAPAVDVFGFGNWVCKEVEKITNMFNSIRSKHTSEEELAGINKLQFGVFGILDWYAKRMGINDQNEINDIKWVRIFTCMKNDNEEAEYQRRLQKVYMDKNKLRK